MAETLAFLDFFMLVDRSLTDPQALTELERRYRADAAVLVLDFSGMVQRTAAHGIIYALARARAAMAAVEPTLQVHGGRPVKRIADTLFTVFPTPKQALFAALDAQVRTDQFNRDADDPIHAGVGLGWGPCFILPGQDLYGSEVNRAFVLGEELAEGGEVLMTPAFVDALKPIPSGIGIHETNADRAHQGGFPFFEARDYRD
ncbi:MAG: hypothetical protein AAFV53_05400 [Myxococcota bacterium]